MSTNLKFPKQVINGELNVFLSKNELRNLARRRKIATCLRAAGLCTILQNGIVVLEIPNYMQSSNIYAN